MCAQEVAPSQNFSSARLSLRPADHIHPAGHPDAREMHSLNDMTLPQSHTHGSRCRERTNLGSTSGDPPVIWTSSRAVEPLRRAYPGHVLHAQIVSHVARPSRVRT